MATTVVTGTSDASRKSLVSQITTYEGVRACTGLLGSGYTLILGGKSVDGAGTATTNNLLTLFKVTGTTTLADGSVRYSYEWRRPNPPLVNAHIEDAQAATLTDGPHLGKVLVCGGHTNLASTSNVSTLIGHIRTPSEVFTAIASGNMTAARGMHRATLLQDSRVFVTGGFTTSPTALVTTELWTPTTEAWTSKASMSQARYDHAQVTLPNGKVLVCGGLTGSGTYTSKAEVYDPTGNTWTSTGSMAFARAGHAAVVLPSGQVLVVGGTGYEVSFSSTPVELASAEVYDPTLGSWRVLPPLRAGRARPALVYVPALATVLVAGGDVTSVELLDLARGSWVPSLGGLSKVRREVRAVVLPEGAVLLAGGEEFTGSVWRTNEFSHLFAPGAETVFTGGVEGFRKVVTVPSPTQLTFASRPVPGVAGSGGTVGPVQASAVGFIAPHIFDPAGVSVTETQATVAVRLEAGVAHTSLRLQTSGPDPSPATRFPDEDGYLVFRFGREGQVGPIRYRGRLSISELRLDASIVFSGTVEAGDDVTLLDGRAAFTPEDPTSVGVFVMTAAPAGRSMVQRTIEDIAAGGMGLTFAVQYPGDRGLGAEGEPTSGAQRLSGIVEAFADDAVDAEVQERREA
jgi:hypothetical protein